jgi:hypothetical protein
MCEIKTTGFNSVGIEVNSFKVDYKTAGNSTVTILDFLPSAGNLELTETGVREILGRLFYVIKS